MTKKAYLFGEIHGSEAVCLKEFEIWQDFYKHGLRHLFIESSYFEAQYLNKWMESGDNTILDEIWTEEADTVGNSVFSRDFYIKIKQNCPKTVFHGTDIGHAFNSTGKKFIETLSHDSEEYRISAENIEQGKKYYESWKKSFDGKYSDSESIREKAMADNFIREFDSVDDDIVGIYGEAHIFSDGIENFGIEKCMCHRIEEYYSDKADIIPELIKNLIKPLYFADININNKIYKASCFGKIFTPFDESCEYIEIFRINEPENDFKGFIKIDNFIPEALYPCNINNGDVFVIDSIKDKKTVTRQIFVCDNYSEEYGKITTEIEMETL